MTLQLSMRDAAALSSCLRLSMRDAAALSSSHPLAHPLTTAAAACRRIRSRLTSLCRPSFMVAGVPLGPFLPSSSAPSVHQGPTRHISTRTLACPAPLADFLLVHYREAACLALQASSLSRGARPHAGVGGRHADWFGEGTCKVSHNIANRLFSA